jgi:thiosulfate dehydrogenase
MKHSRTCASRVPRCFPKGRPVSQTASLILEGVLIGICVPLVAGYLFVILGGMPVATKGDPLPIEQFLAKKGLDAAIGKEAGKPSPLSADEANLLAGARVYQQVQCWVCHGHLGQPQAAIAKGMYPPPPQLLSPEQGVTDDPVGVTYWKVKNGIRLTGMPAFNGSLMDSEMWLVSLLLLNADKLSTSVEEVLRH